MTAAGPGRIGPGESSGLIEAGDDGVGNGAGRGIVGDAVRAAQAATAIASTTVVQIRDASRTPSMRRPIGQLDRELQSVTLTR